MKELLIGLGAALLLYEWKQSQTAIQNTQATPIISSNIGGGLLNGNLTNPITVEPKETFNIPGGGGAGGSDYNGDKDYLTSQQAAQDFNTWVEQIQIACTGSNDTNCYHVKPGVVKAPESE